MHGNLTYIHAWDPDIFCGASPLCLLQKTLPIKRRGDAEECWTVSSGDDEKRVQTLEAVRNQFGQQHFEGIHIWFNQHTSSAQIRTYKSLEIPWTRAYPANDFESNNFEILFGDLLRFSSFDGHSWLANGNIEAMIVLMCNVPEVSAAIYDSLFWFLYRYL
jgi:hypothetical protein